MVQLQQLEIGHFLCFEMIKLYVFVLEKFFVSPNSKTQTVRI